MAIKSKNIETITDEVNLFIRHIESLRETLPMTMTVLQAVGKNFETLLHDFENKNCSVKTEGENSYRTIPLEHISEWKKHNTNHDQFYLARKLIPRSF